MNRILRESNEQKNSVMTPSDSPSGSVKMQQNKRNLKYINYLKFLHPIVPNRIELDAYKLISNLKESKVISIDDLEYITLSGTDDEVKSKDLFSAIVVHSARVSHIESFLSKILKHNDENINKNQKFIKHDYEL